MKTVFISWTVEGTEAPFPLSTWKETVHSARNIHAHHISRRGRAVRAQRTNEKPRGASQWKRSLAEFWNPSGFRFVQRIRFISAHNTVPRDFASERFRDLLLGNVAHWTLAAACSLDD